MNMNHPGSNPNKLRTKANWHTSYNEAGSVWTQHGFSFDFTDVFIYVQFNMKFVLVNIIFLSSFCRLMRNWLKICVNVAILVASKTLGTGTHLLRDASSVIWELRVGSGTFDTLKGACGKTTTRKENEQKKSKFQANDDNYKSMLK